MARARGFVVIPKSCCPLPLSSEAGLSNEKGAKTSRLRDSGSELFRELRVAGFVTTRAPIVFCERFRKQVKASRMIIEDYDVDRLRPERTGIGGEAIFRCLWCSGANATNG